MQAQRDYAATRHIPWGISESAFNTRDLDQTYQYSPFGVPALGLKRGLANDLVVAPYATGLAAMVDPAAAAANFRLLAEAGGLGRFGFYEALDFTPERLADGEAVAIVRAYMAHHQGMTVVAIANALTGGAVQGYFHAEAAARATELLLQEKPPRSVEDAPEALEAEAREARFPVSAGRRRLQTWRPRTPHTQLSEQRPLRGHGQRQRRRLQPLRQSGGDALERGRHLRSQRAGDLPARSRQRRGLVGRLCPDRGQARFLSRHLFRGPRRDCAARRTLGDAPAGAGVGRT